MEMNILKFFKSKIRSPQQEDKELKVDGTRQVEEKKKINVEECTCLSKSTDNSVTIEQ